MKSCICKVTIGSDIDSNNKWHFYKGERYRYEKVSQYLKSEYKVYCSDGAWFIFYVGFNDYFYTEKEYRKLKIDKINNL